MLACVPTAHETSLCDGSRGAILITRPEPAAAETATRVAAMGFHPIVAPMMTIRTMAPLRLAPTPRSGRPHAASGGDPIGILVTSGNALPALGADFHDIPLWAVGSATATRARQAGFRTVTSAGGDATALINLITDRICPTQGRLLLVSGRGQGMDLAATLRARGYRITRRIAYATQPTRALPDAALSALRTGSVSHVLFFSAETARVFHRLVRRLGLSQLLAGCDALAISRRTEVALRDLPWRRISVAAAPDQDSLLALLP